jgi:hypothetical protein
MSAPLGASIDRRRACRCSFRSGERLFEGRDVLTFVLVSLVISLLPICGKADTPWLDRCIAGGAIQESMNWTSLDFPSERKRKKAALLEHYATRATMTPPPHEGTDELGRKLYRAVVEHQRELAWDHLAVRSGHRDMDLSELAAISRGAVGRILEGDVYVDGRALTDELPALVEETDRERLAKAAEPEP